MTQHQHDDQGDDDTSKNNQPHHHHVNDPAHDHPNDGDHGHDDTAGAMPLYMPPRQRQRWGEKQHAVHNNWGDIFFDLFFVALACKFISFSVCFMPFCNHVLVIIVVAAAVASSFSTLLSSHVIQRTHGTSTCFHNNNQRALINIAARRCR